MNNLFRVFVVQVTCPVLDNPTVCRARSCNKKQKAIIVSSIRMEKNDDVLRQFLFLSDDSFISKKGLLILQILLRSEVMPSKTKISDGYSTVLPAEIRKALNLTPGDILQWDVEDGIITIHPRKKVTLTGICGVISAGGDAVNDKKKIQSGEV
jgi:AbrB family looped-hinge helix DNA binding protein